VGSADRGSSGDGEQERNTGTRATAWLGARRAAIPIVALAVLASTLSARPAGANTVGDIARAKDQLATILKRVDAAVKERDRIQRELTDLLTKVDLGRRSIEATQARIVDTQLSLRGVSAAMASQQATIDRRAAEAYMGGAGADVAAMLEASSFQDLTERLADLEAESDLGVEVNAGLTTQKRQLVQGETTLQALYTKKRGTLDAMNVDAAKLADDLRAQRAVVGAVDADRARIAALLKTLQDRRQRELAKEALRRSHWGGRGAPPPPPPPPTGGPKKVVDLIKHYFTPQGPHNLQTALCVGWRESRYIPTAVNRASGASGVYQFMPNLWPWFSSTAGWKGANVFDPVANVAVAAYIVDHFGWYPWHSDSGYCDT
jgi:peptidoglycan hydrolase CwlO-like protein